MSREPERRFKDLREMGRELLVLAGQRTRITWGLSFGDVKDTLASSAQGRSANGNSAASPVALHRRKRAVVVALSGGAQVLMLAVVLYAVFSGRFGGERAGPHPSVSGVAAPAASPIQPPTGTAARTPDPDGRPVTAADTEASSAPEAPARAGAGFRASRERRSAPRGSPSSGRGRTDWSAARHAHRESVQPISFGRDARAARGPGTGAGMGAAERGVDAQSDQSRRSPRRAQRCTHLRLSFGRPPKCVS